MAKRQMLEIEALSPTLRKFLLAWIEPENWTKSIAELCAELGLRTESVYRAIERAGKIEFYELKARLIDRMFAKVYNRIANTLVKKAQEGDMKAIEIYLKLTNRLQERKVVEANIDVRLQQAIAEAKKKAEEIDEL